jgi:hypothetical protein
MIIIVLLYVEMDIEKQEKHVMMEIQVLEMDVLLHALLKVDGIAVPHIQVFVQKVVLLVVLEKNVDQTLVIRQVAEVAQMLMEQIHVQMEYVLLHVLQVMETATQ